jgi:CSLREA domain-containing protein
LAGRPVAIRALAPRGVAAAARALRSGIFSRRLISVGLLATVLFLAIASDGSAATFTVSRLDDPAPDGCSTNGCTLREAVQAANDRPGPDAVVMGEGRYVLSQAGTGEDAGATGDLDLRGPLTIAGSGVKETHIDAQPIGISAPDSGDRVFDLHGGDVTLRGFRTDNSEVAGNGGGIRATGGGSLLLDRVRIADATAGGDGGGVFTGSGYSLRLVFSRIDDDHSGGDGGGIFAKREMTLSRSVVDDNHAGGDGGGLFAARSALLSHSGVHDSEARGFGGDVAASGRLTVVASVLHSGHARRGGGAVYLKGHATRDSISRSTLTSNHTTGIGAPGGAVLVDGPRLGITNSTIAYNESRGGGGAVATLGGRVRLSSSTVTQNRTSRGRGGGLLGGGGIIAMRNTIIAANTAGGRVSDCAGSVRSKGYNLSGFHCGALGARGDVRTRHPRLGPVENHGGPNATASLRAGSPAIDAGGPGCPGHDQRGYGRRGPCDIGSFEFRGIRRG